MHASAGCSTARMESGRRRPKLTAQSIIGACHHVWPMLWLESRPSRSARSSSLVSGCEGSGRIIRAEPQRTLLHGSRPGRASWATKAIDRLGRTRCSAPPSREPGQGRDIRSSSPRTPPRLHAMGPRNGAPWRRRWPAANDYASGF
ncbi:hypothetical protein SETIT_7G287500v2 [Setaria italica]|uniref:Uncharacterized protein n=1 Tax=Setaria italica TaxID=4555 RepID=A0A368S0U9_SETIT|nr:hypothetical protein SETIT_7G287500v2 [Setaria italica]